MKNHLQNALISAGCGAVFGALASLVVNTLAVRIRLRMHHRKIRLEPQSLEGCCVSARIFNGYIFPMSDAVAYITIEHQLGDVLQPPPGSNAFITNGHLRQLKEDRLCWSRAGNPGSIDIFAGEKQSLDVFEIDPQGKWIQIPSEQGWGTRGAKSRVFLRPKKYIGRIKIVSKDTKAKEFKIEIDCGNGSEPLRCI